MDYNAFYKILFSKVEQEIGLVDEETISAIVGFSAGGPVSLSQVESKKVFITCELSLYPQQKKSSEKINFEFISIGDFEMEWCRRVFTSLGALSMDAVLGHGHTINISEIVDSEDTRKRIKLLFYSQSTYKGKKYGIYRVVPDI